jgi:hypothetical protein
MSRTYGTIQQGWAVWLFEECIDRLDKELTMVRDLFGWIASIIDGLTSYKQSVFQVAEEYVDFMFHIKQESAPCV